MINRLCKHFQYKVDAQWTAEAGELRFAIGDCHLQAADGALLMTCEAEDSVQEQPSAA